MENWHTKAVNTTGLYIRFNLSILENRLGTGGNSGTGFDCSFLGGLCRRLRSRSTAFLLKLRKNDVFQEEENCSGEFRGENAVNFDLGTFPNRPNWTQQEFIHPEDKNFSCPSWATLCMFWALVNSDDDGLKSNNYTLKMY